MPDITPKHLYKVLSWENWQASGLADYLALPPEDEAFIHFSREDQLERILMKFWADVEQYVVLKIEREALIGRLVFEPSPGRETKYYHLYEGSIPMTSIVEVSIQNKKTTGSFSKR